MAQRDLYEVIGVPRTASEKEIRQSYRRLARKHHPDLNPNDKEKRAKYDRFGHNWERFESAGAASGAPPQGAGSRFNWTSSGADFDIGSVFGSDLFGSLLNEARGRAGGRAASGRPPTLRGEDVEHTVEISLEEAYAGTHRTLQLMNADGSLRTLEVKIPAGVATGSRIRFSGQGGPGMGGGASGDLLLAIAIRPHETYERSGDDLQVVVPVPLATAVLGGEVTVPTLRGSRLALKVPPESQNGQRIRLSGQGMPRLSGSGRGDLFAELRVVLPQGLSTRERDLFRELESLRKD